MVECRRRHDILSLVRSVNGVSVLERMDSPLHCINVGRPLENGIWSLPEPRGRQARGVPSSATEASPAMRRSRLSSDIGHGWTAAVLVLVVPRPHCAGVARTGISIWEDLRLYLSRLCKVEARTDSLFVRLRVALLNYLQSLQVCARRTTMLAARKSR